LAPRSGAIDSTIDRITSASADGYRLRIGRLPEGMEPGNEWLAVDEVLASEALKAGMLVQVAGVTERPAEHIGTEWMIESWARAIADLAGSFLISSRQLPDLSPSNLLVAPYKGMVSATAVRSELMTVLEADADWKPLADLMHEGLVTLFGPMINWADLHGLRPAKTLWHSCGDRVAQSLLWSGKAFNEEDFALELTEYLMNLGGPMAVPIEREIDESGQPFHLRTTCCLAYRTPEGGYCQACPLIREIRPPV
jgi:FhuF 2Fe-2S C-terminal domain